MFARSVVALIGLVAACGPALADRAGPLRIVVEKKDLGPSGTAIVLNNCDDSDGDGYPDNSDEYLIGEKDRQQLTPLRIQSPKAPLQGPVVLRLRNEQPDAMEPSEKIRVFRARAEPSLDSTQGLRYPSVLGGRRGTEYALDKDDLAKLEKEDLALYVEGLQFGVSAKLALFSGDTQQDEITLEVAPFLLIPHTQPPVGSMVVKVDPSRWPRFQDSPRYVADFVAASDRARQSSRNTPATFQPEVLKVEHRDVWIEDELQWGYTQTPRATIPVALHMHRQRELRSQVRNLLAAGVGYFTAFNYSLAVNAADGSAGDSIDYGGNLEVTPPTEKWPFGRVYYGGRQSPRDAYESPRQIADGFQKFFKRQKRTASDPVALQEPIALCSDWLAVGHVDEIVSFVPANTKKGFVLLWASPSRAMELLEGLPGRLRQDRGYLSAAHYTHYNCHSVDELLDLDWKTINKEVAGFLGQQSLKDFNRKVEQKIRQNVEIFKRELDLDDADIKAVPVLFCNDRRGVSWGAFALTPGMVNLSSWGHLSVIPRPFIPIFQNDFANTLKPLGQVPEFIDDWSIYHIMEGEVHCGSNTRRQPFDRAWWDSTTAVGGRQLTERATTEQKR